MELLPISTSQLVVKSKASLFRCEGCEYLLTIQGSQKCRQCKMNYCAKCLRDKQCPRCPSEVSGDGNSGGIGFEGLHRIVQNQLEGVEVRCTCGCDQVYKYRDLI